MTTSRFIEIDKQFGEVTLHAALLDLDNARFYFFGEDQLNLGTLAIALGLSSGNIPGISQVLLGSIHQTWARTLAEYLSYKINKPVVLSLFFKNITPTKDVLTPLIDLLHEEKQNA